MSLSGAVYIACSILNCSQICLRAIKGIVHPTITNFSEKYSIILSGHLKVCNILVFAVLK